MLTDLAITNIAIIDSLHVAFRPGFNVLTGETGAGKSIIIDAVNLLLGGRASSELVRSGEEEATVEAIFDLAETPDVVADLAASGIDENGELVVKRTVNRAGRNRVFLNGSLATTAQLAAIAPRLINIYGQHDSQTLLRLANHLELLDGFGQLQELRASYAACYGEHRRTLEALRLLEQDERDAARRLDLLGFQSDEISAAGLRPGEDEELEREQQFLAHAERLHQGTRNAYERLYGDDGSLLARQTEVRRMVADCAAIDSNLTPLVETLADAGLQLEDVALALRTYAAQVESDPDRLRAVEDRLDLIRRLKKKYAPSIEEILALKDAGDREKEALLHREENRETLERRREELAVELRRNGEELSARRKAAAAELSSAMTAELASLAMKDTLFRVDFQPLVKPGPAGLDQVEFLFSSNPGEPPRPLARIASGGELSRLMLAIKQVHPESDVPTLVFDEVDSGIGGAVASLVGEKLGKVALRQQVLCITHLPQVAAHADHHYLVEKLTEVGRTTTSVRCLGVTEQVEELARMLGGVTLTETTRQHAREMIDAARNRTPSTGGSLSGTKPPPDTLIEEGTAEP